MHVKIVRRFCTLGLPLLVGCGGMAEESDLSAELEERAEGLTACERTFTIELPPGMTAAGLVLGSTEALTLSDRVQLTAPAPQPAPTSANLGTGTLELGVDASSGSLFAQGAVQLRDRAGEHASANGQYQADCGHALPFRKRRCWVAAVRHLSGTGSVDLIYTIRVMIVRRGHSW